MSGLYSSTQGKMQVSQGTAQSFAVPCEVPCAVPCSWQRRKVLKQQVDFSKTLLKVCGFCYCLCVCLFLLFFNIITNIKIRLSFIYGPLQEN